MSSPLIQSIRVVPVAGHDSMLLNLSGAHGPFFTRNLLILTDSAGHTGVGEVPGGEKIRQTLDDAAALLIGQPIGAHLQLLQRVQQTEAVHKMQHLEELKRRLDGEKRRASAA